MSESAALDVIRERRGTMYDPLVVDTFLQICHEISVPTSQPRLQAVMHNLRRSAPGHSEPPTASAENPGTSASVSVELLGFVSLARLTSGSAMVHDIGAALMELSLRFRA